jgi:hypothetical protein
MAVMKTLSASGSLLRFKPVEGSVSWELYVERGRRRGFLGDQNGETMRASLLAFLQGRSQQRKALHPDGLEWQWIFSTAEPYHFVFGRVVPAGFVLKLWNGSEKTLTAEITVREADAEAWRSELTRWGDDPKRGS